jgi:hypothetical protein
MEMDLNKLNNFSKVSKPAQVKP